MHSMDRNLAPDAPVNHVVRHRLNRLDRLTALASALLIVAACGATTPSASPTPAAASIGPTGAIASAPPSGPAASQAVDAKAIYAAIEDQVVALRGLEPKAAVDPQVLDDAGIKKFVKDSFDKDNPSDVVAANERLLKAFDLLPRDASLKDLYLDLLGSQVAGLYSPDDKKLFVVSRSGAVGPAEKTTFAHEFTHALQDQNFELGKLRLDEIGQGDRSFARLALVEGDATLSMSYWQIQNLTQAELGQIISAAGSDPSTQILLKMPAILRESLLFPYTTGLGFAQGLQASGGWGAVDEAYGTPPASTEQILHPEKYASSEEPIAVTLPADLATRLGNGWKVGLEDTFGEFQLGVWLRASGAINAATANDASTGWGGDRIAVLDGPNGAWSVVLRTAWDTSEDAAAFEAAATSLVEDLSSPASLLRGAGGTERWIVVGSDDTTLGAVAGVLGLAG